MSEPEIEMVESSKVKAVGYDPEAREIYVRFLSGHTYVFAQADETLFEELRSADSVGGYFNRVVKPNHGYRVV
jgi:KTSC domain